MLIKKEQFCGAINLKDQKVCPEGYTKHEVKFEAPSIVKAICFPNWYYDY